MAIEIDPSSPTPRTSTRDREELRKRLSAWLAARRSR